MKTRQQAIVAAVAALLLSVIFFVLALRPKLNDITGARADIRAAEQQERTLRNELNRLRDLAGEATTTTARLARAQRYLPPEPDLPGFIRLVQASATRASVELQSIAPSAPSDLEDASGIQVIAVTLNVKAGFRRIEDFLSRIENLDRIFEVTQLSLSPEADSLSDQIVLNATIGGQMYIVREGARVGGGSAARPSPTPSPGATS